MCGKDPFWENKTTYKWSVVRAVSFARAALCLSTVPLKPTHEEKALSPVGTE